MASRTISPRSKPNHQVAELLQAINRSRLSLTQVERRTAISAVTISNWRSGRHQPSPNSVKMILRWLWGDEMSGLSTEGRIHHLLSVNRRLLSIARECEFDDLVAEIRAEIKRLKQLRRLAAAARPIMRASA